MRDQGELTSDELKAIVASFMEARARLHRYVLHELYATFDERGLVIEQEAIEAEVPAIVGEVRELVARLVNELLGTPE